MEQRSTPRTTSMHVWYVAGGLLIASVLLGPYVRIDSQIGLNANVIPALMFSLALVAFAIGDDRSTSVTARRPVGTISLIVLAAWTFFTAMLRLKVPTPPLIETLLSFGYVDQIVQFVLAIIVATQIARANTVPRPASLAPLWVVAAIAASWVIQQIVAVTAGPNVSATIVLPIIIDSLVRVAGPVLLGIIAIALASRATGARTTTTTT